MRWVCSGVRVFVRSVVVAVVVVVLTTFISTLPLNMAPMWQFIRSISNFKLTLQIFDGGAVIRSRSTRPPPPPPPRSRSLSSNLSPNFLRISYSRFLENYLRKPMAVLHHQDQDLSLLSPLRILIFFNRFPASIPFVASIDKHMKSTSYSS